MAQVKATPVTNGVLVNVNQPAPVDDDQPTAVSAEGSPATADGGTSMEGVGAEKASRSGDQQQQFWTNADEALTSQGNGDGVSHESKELAPEDDPLSAVEEIAVAALPLLQSSILPCSESSEAETEGGTTAESSPLQKETAKETSAVNGQIFTSLLQQDDGTTVAFVDVPVSSSTHSTSRTICLRSLRSGTDGPVQAQPPTPPGLASGSQPSSSEALAGGGGGGAFVGVMGNKVVDLREVKKVRPVILTPMGRTLSPVPNADGTAEEGEEGEEEEPAGGGLVKVDLSAGKRMIEFQLKVNAAEEKREAVRIKSERERADAAIAQESQRMLDQVNARLEAQRRERGSFGVGGGGSGARALAEAQIRVLAERHGIRLQILNEEKATAVGQIRALAREHGFRVHIMGDEDTGEDAYGDDGYRDVEGRISSATGAQMTVPGIYGGDGSTGMTESTPTSVVTSTPPPMLSSLRLRLGTRSISPSAAPRTMMKPPARKTPAVPSLAPPKEGGMFLGGPARMMRMALQASGGCMPGGGKDVSPVRNRATIDAFSLPAVEKSQGDQTSDDADATPANVDESVSSTVAVGAAGTRSALPSRDRRSSPTPSIDRAAVCDSCDVFSETDSARERGVADDKNDNEVTSSTNTSNGKVTNEQTEATVEGAPPLSGGRRKRDAISRSASTTSSSSDRDGQAGDVQDGKRSKKNPTGSGGGGGSGGSSTPVSTTARAKPSLSSALIGGSGVSASTKKEGTGATVLTPLTASTGPPKRMRLVGASGVVSQPSSQPSTPARPGGRRGAGNGGAGWTPGNNNLFKGAMAGIMGRGKRPSP